MSVTFRQFVRRTCLYRLQISVISCYRKHEPRDCGRLTRALCPFQARLKFSYGPGVWEQQFPIVRTGLRQSPIDIDPKVAVYNEKLAKTPLVINYEAEAYLPVSNTGLSLQVNCRKLSEVHGGPLSTAFRLDNFHFHWGSKNLRGSEHKIYGKVFPGEVHFVHWNMEKYKSLKDAMDKPDGLAVLAVFLSLGKEHPSFARLVEVLDRVTLRDSKGFLTSFRPFSLLPQNTRDYWTYVGSLTTPPFYESVTWIVFKHVMEVSIAQMEALRGLCCDDYDDYIVDNCRPPMPLGARCLEASFFFEDKKHDSNK